MEIAHKLGSFSLNLEVGSYVPIHGDHEGIVGLVVGRQLSSRLELDGPWPAL